MHSTAHDLVRRAIRSYFHGAPAMARDQPSNTSELEHADGRSYVVLRSARGVLAVYRVRRDGRLRRLSRWPTGLDEHLGDGRGGALMSP